MSSGRELIWHSRHRNNKHDDGGSTFIHWPCDIPETWIRQCHQLLAHFFHQLSIFGVTNFTIHKVIFLSPSYLLISTAVKQQKQPHHAKKHSHLNGSKLPRSYKNFSEVISRGIHGRVQPLSAVWICSPTLLLVAVGDSNRQMSNSSTISSSYVLIHKLLFLRFCGKFSRKH